MFPSRNYHQNMKPSVRSPPLFKQADEIFVAVDHAFPWQFTFARRDRWARNAKST